MQKISIKSFVLLPIIFFFLPAFVFWIPFLKAGYMYFFIFLYLSICLLFITNYKYHLLKLIRVYYKTPLKYFIWMLGLVVINSLFLIIIGKVNTLNSIRAIIMQIFLFVLPTMTYFICIIGKYISLKNFMRFFLILYWLMLIVGFIAYLGQYLNIEFINNIFDFFANARLLRYKNLGIQKVASNYIEFGLPRLDNLFEEPSFYARFLFLFLPMVYTFGLTKIKLYKNKVLNWILKKTIIPFTWLNIILTLSPIFLILSFLITLIYFSKEVFLLLKRYWTIIALSIFIVIIVLSKIDLSETYLSRIINILSQVRSFEDFILIEASLATRLCSYINAFILFLKNPFTGVGFGSIQQALVTQFFNSPIALTPEIISRVNLVLKTNIKYTHNSNFVVDLIAMNGIFVFSIFVYFYYKILKKIKLLFLKSSNECFDFLIFKSLYYILIGLIIKSFYDSSFIDLDMYLILSLAILVIFYSKKGDNNNA